jgi:hypothetical protein
MVAQALFFRELTGPGLPCRLPSAADVPAQICFREVAQHPAGGWTIAEPVDATKSALRIYRGNWSSRAAALAAMEGHG